MCGGRRIGPARDKGRMSWLLARFSLHVAPLGVGVERQEANSLHIVIAPCLARCISHDPPCQDVILAPAKGSTNAASFYAAFFDSYHDAISTPFYPWPTSYGFGHLEIV